MLIVEKTYGTKRIGMKGGQIVTPQIHVRQIHPRMVALEYIAHEIRFCASTNMAPYRSLQAETPERSQIVERFHILNGFELIAG